jgi:hypothetical protein
MSHDDAPPKPMSPYQPNTFTSEVVRRGCEIRAARVELDKLIKGVVQRAKKKYPDFLPALAEALDGARLELVSLIHQQNHERRKAEKK